MRLHRTSFRAPRFGSTVFALVLFGSGCSWIRRPPDINLSGYTYIPLDPLSPKLEYSGCVHAGASKSPTWDIASQLPDNSVRVSVESWTASGSANFETAVITTKGSRYKVTADYVNADTVNIPIWIQRKVRRGAPCQAGGQSCDDSGTRWECLSVFENYADDQEWYSDVYLVSRVRPGRYECEPVPYSLPTYVGVGLRVTANIVAKEDDINVSGLGALGAEGEKKSIDGALMVQTLGINGKSVAAALPIPNRLDETTAQNAVASIGAVKTLLYDEKVNKAPRVVGFYMPVPGQRALVNAIMSALMTEPVPWRLTCSSE